MKINVGDYIRTKTGIHKVFEINEKATVWKYLCDKKPTGEWDGSYEYTTIKEENIIKSAEGTPRGLLDLIESGDYVNGHKVIEHSYEPGRLFVENIYVGGKGQTTIEDYSYELTSKYCYDEPYFIKSVLTHEQFESMQYIVKED